MDAGERLCYFGSMQASLSVAQILQAPTPALIALCENTPRTSAIPEILAQLALRGEPCGVLVAHNRFDVYAIGNAVVRANGSREAALKQIDIVRAETGPQLHGCLRRLANKPPRFRFLFVLGLLEPFYDEDLRPARAEWLLNDSLRQLQGLSAHGAHLIVTLAPPPNPSPRARFLRLVQQHVDLVIPPQGPALENPIQPKLEL